MTELPLPGGRELPSTPGFDLPLVTGGGLPLDATSHRCGDTAALILQALEGMPDPGVVEAVRSQLAPCPPCAQSLELEVRFKVAMAQRATEHAPPSLQLRISDALQRVDLSDIDVTDL